MKIPLNAFPCFPLQWQQGGKNWHSLFSQLHSNSSWGFSTAIPGNICCGRSQAFYFFQPQLCCFCIIHLLPAVWAQGQHQTRNNTDCCRGCCWKSELDLNESTVPPPPQVLLALPFLFSTLIPICLSPLSTSSSPQAAAKQLQPACSPPAWERASPHSCTLSIAQQDLSFPTAPARKRIWTWSCCFKIDDKHHRQGV